MEKKILLSAITVGSFLIFGAWYRNTRTTLSLPATETANTNSLVIPTRSPGMMNGGQMMSGQGGYKDGTYVGDSTDAFYGFIQVQAVIQNGKITDVQFLSYPNDRRTSIMINQQAMPLLKQEAIAAQSYNVNIVSGATDSSQAFVQSLKSALIKAKSI